MRIFLTGGTGFIGSHFINLAHEARHEIVALRRSANSRPRFPLQKEPSWLDGAIRDLTPNHLAHCDAIVHLAACGVSPQIATLEEMIEGNIAAPAVLFQLAAEYGIRRWVVTGTFAEYGKSGERYDFIPENAPLEPTYPYAATKAAAFSLLHAAAITKSAELAYLRIFSAYGPGQHPTNLWPALQLAAKSAQDYPLSPGDQIRDFIPVTDVAKALLLAATRQDIHAGIPWIRNLGSGHPMSVRSFCQREWSDANATGRLLPGVIPYRDNEVMRFCPLIQDDLFSCTP